MKTALLILLIVAPSVSIGQEIGVAYGSLTSNNQSFRTATGPSVFVLYPMTNRLHLGLAYSYFSDEHAYSGVTLGSPPTQELIRAQASMSTAELSLRYEFARFKEFAFVCGASVSTSSLEATHRGIMTGTEVPTLPDRKPGFGVLIGVQADDIPSYAFRTGVVFQLVRMPSTTFATDVVNVFSDPLTCSSVRVEAAYVFGR